MTATMSLGYESFVMQASLRQQFTVHHDVEVLKKFWRATVLDFGQLIPVGSVLAELGEVSDAHLTEFRNALDSYVSHYGGINGPSFAIAFLASRITRPLALFEILESPVAFDRSLDQTDSIQIDSWSETKLDTSVRTILHARIKTMNNSLPRLESPLQERARKACERLTQAVA